MFSLCDKIKALTTTLIMLLLSLVSTQVFAGKVPAWKIVYGSAEGPEGSALELLTSDLGEIILRESGVYATHVLPLIHANENGKSGNVNAVIVGTVANNKELAKYVKAKDVPKDGYLVRTLNEGARKLVLIAGDGPREVLWGAADFVMDGIMALRPNRGNNIKYASDVFFTDKPIGEYVSARRPQTKVRSVFTWGHPIDDFRDYIRNLARLKFNRVYFWNDYPPLNAADIVDYAHRWGIEVYWGFAWGWSTNCRETSARNDDALIKGILDGWRNKWKKLPGDGIYFQTFTETNDKLMEGETVAERAVRLVNRVSAEMLREEPQLKIVFGLHATSVKHDMATIAKTDPRIEILWEDTANFPYSSAPINISAADGAKLTADVMASKGHTIGIVWKSQLVQDWTNWTYQEGPFLMGVTSRRTFNDDVAIQDALWKNYTTQWIINFPLAYAAARQAHRRGEDFELCVAAQLNGPLRLPTMLTAELFWSSSDPAEKILARVLDRNR